MNVKDNLKNQEEIFNLIFQSLSPFLIKNNYFNINVDDLKNEILLLVIESNQEDFYKSKSKYINIIKNELMKKYSNSDNKPLSDSTKTYLSEIRSYKLLSKEEEIDLFNKYKNGNLDAKKEIIERNLRLVVSVAKSYYKLGVPLLDLIQDGNIGLMKAVDRFDPNLGFRFSTYAVYWIRQHITRAIATKEKTIKIPVHIVTNLIKIKKYENEYFQKHGKEPSLEEISKKLEITQEEIKEIKSYDYDFTSMNKTINDEDELEIGDTIASNEDLDDEVILSSLSNELMTFFKKANLTKDQIIVITYRFGLTGEAPYSFEKIGKMIKKTRERVRQIEIRAMIKLKKSPYKNNILNYYDDKYDLSNDSKQIIKRRHF